jgi:hypothetical protein
MWRQERRFENGERYERVREIRRGERKRAACAVAALTQFMNFLLGPTSSCLLVPNPLTVLS